MLKEIVWPCKSVHVFPFVPSQSQVWFAEAYVEMRIHVQGVDLGCGKPGKRKEEARQGRGGSPARSNPAESREGGVSLILLESSKGWVTAQSGPHLRQAIGAFLLLHLSFAGTAPKGYKFYAHAKASNSPRAELWKSHGLLRKKAQWQRSRFKTGKKDTEMSGQSPSIIYHIHPTLPLPVTSGRFFYKFILERL